jgi:hypothetical protein
MEICCPKIVRFRLFWGFFVSTYPPQTLTNSQSINSVNSLQIQKPNDRVIPNVFQIEK